MTEQINSYFCSVFYYNKKMKNTKKLLILFFIGLVNFGQSQNIVLSGSVVDGRNGQPLQYVNIYIKGTNRGTVTNIEGKFDLPIQKKYINDTIVFSYVGYKQYKTIVENLRKHKKIRLYPYIQTINTVLVGAKKPDPAEILYKAIKNTPENIYDSLCSANVFVRQFVKKDSSFIVSRKTITKVEMYRDNVWFVRGDIVADQYLTIGKGLKYIKPYDLFSPPIDYQREPRKIPTLKSIKKNRTIVIDTVIFSKNQKIYIIDRYNIKTENVKQIKSIIENNPSPYTLIFDTTLRDIGEYFLDNKKINFDRFYIDARQNYNIIKYVNMYTMGVNGGNTFVYNIAEFSNQQGKSQVKHVLTYKQQVIKNKDKTSTDYQSLMEFFCYNEKYMHLPAVRIKNRDEKIWSKYMKAIESGRLKKSFDNWENNQSYIKTDTLEQKAIEEILNEIKN